MASLVRPRSVRSGEPLQDKLNVAHRTDILIKEQVQVIQDLQDSLAKSLKELQHSRSITEVDFHNTQVHILRAKSEEMVLKLQVASKVNDELLFAREILKKAIREDNEAQNARDRVEWLEGRIETLLDKPPESLSSDSLLADREVEIVPYTQPPLQQSLEKLDKDDSISHDLERASLEDKSDLQSPFGKLPEDFYSQKTDTKQQKTKTKRRQRRATSVEGSTISSDTPYSDIQNETERILQGRLDSEDDTSPIQLGKQGRHRKVTQELTLATEATVYPASSLYSSDEERSEDLSSSEAGEESEEISSEEEEEEEEAVMKNGSLKAESEDGSYTDESTTTKGTDSVQSQDQNSQSTISVTSDQQAQKKVTLQEVKTETPGNLGAEDSGVFLTETVELPGGASDYWSSKHHQYEWNDYASALLEENPLSYHQLGLAVHSNYVETYEPGSPELPWRPRRKGSDIIDPHRKALDKLSRSLRGMYERVEQAAESSVQVDPRWSNKDWREPVALSSLGLGSQAAATATPGTPAGKLKMPSISRVTGLAPPPSAESVTFPPVDAQRLGTSQSGRITYYPKPVPPPKKKPITRTDRSVEYPRKADIWNETEPQAAEEQPRIVNQGNMKKETRLVLYKPRRKRPRGSAQSMSEMMGITLKAKKRVALKDPMVLGRSVMNLDLLPKGYTDALKLGRVDPHPVSSGGSAAASLDSMKADRIQALINDAMTSSRPEDRRQAAKGLGVLGMDKENVIEALRDMVVKDENSKVRYEAAKSLLTLGLWDEPTMELLIHHIKDGDDNTRTDLLRTMASAKNIQFIDKRTKSFRCLHKALHTLCSPKNLCEDTAFDAAVCLGVMCVPDDRAKERLLAALAVRDPHKKAQALEVVVRHMNYREPQVREAILEQLKASPVWKYRAAAAKLITYLGPTFLTGEEDIEHVFQILDRRLWDDPKREVRATVALAVDALNMKTRAYELAERRLEDSSEDVRAQAVIALGTLGVRKERTLRLLLEMLELDSSEYVRLQVVRTFCNLGIVDIRAIRSLRERERGEGPLAREAGKAVKFLTELTNSKSAV